MRRRGALSNLEALLDARGAITIGAFGPIRHVVTASDDDITYAMLQRRPGESLADVLARLDASIAWAWEHDELVDEINLPPPTVAKPASALGRKPLVKNRRR